MRLVVGLREAGVRLDRYLLRHLPPRASRAAIQRGIREGAVTVSGRPSKSHYQVKGGEVIVVSDEAFRISRPPHAVPEPIPLEVVYEDELVLVVNKPPGLVTHPAPGHWTGTLVNAVLWHLRQAPASNRKPELPRAGIVHRLDKDTSGLLVVAKTEEALRSLSAQLKARTLIRQYVALVAGWLGPEEGTIQAAVGRHLRHRKQMAVRYLGGREAITHFRVLRRLRTGAGGQTPFRYSLLEVRLKTGRTHQIRVHCSHLGHPVLGDSTYGHHPPGAWRELGIERQLLHAYRLEFLHPSRRRPLELSAALPEDMRRLIGDDVLKSLGMSSRSSA